MKRYYQFTSKKGQDSNNGENVDGSLPKRGKEKNNTSQNAVKDDQQVHLGSNETILRPTPSSSRQTIVDSDLPKDPGVRKQIWEYHPNDQDTVRRVYLQRGPFQPRGHDFPRKEYNDRYRRFCPNWFDQYRSWLEYSTEYDSAFCLYCYLFKPKKEHENASGYSFVVGGFKNWKRLEKLALHEKESSGFHNQARRKAEALLNQNQSIRTVIDRWSEEEQNDYLLRLNASIVCIRFLLRQGLSFRGHDESENSSNRGNFLELLKHLADNNGVVKRVALKNAPENLKLTSPPIQKDIVRAFANETAKVIMDELDDCLFSILIDESRDISCKEQMTVVFRFVKMGQVLERFVGVVHVNDTKSVTLKKAIDDLLSGYKLSYSSLRGQGYDGASNMRGEFNGLKALILQENGSAFYIHCFAHQLQLALVSISRNHDLVESLFFTVSHVTNVIGASSKRCDMLREKQAENILKALGTGEIQTGRGLNQESTLKRAGDTRWSSHYDALINMIVVFPATVEVLDAIVSDGLPEQRREAKSLLDTMQYFDFAFTLFFMKGVLGITHALSQALQRKDQDIVNAMDLVAVSKRQMQKMRDSGWTGLLQEVSSFCSKNGIHFPDMNASFVPFGRSRRNLHQVTTLHHYQVELFYTVIDMQIQELNNRFTEVNTELLRCMACLSPNDLFASFDKVKLVALARLYPTDFTNIELMKLDDELETYIDDMRMNNEFHSLKGISTLAQKMVQKKKDIVFPLVYRLITLALILPVATATVERVFSAMGIVKSRLRNSIGVEFLNDCLLTHVEKEILDEIDDDTIVKHFQGMSSRRGQLPRSTVKHT